MFARNIPFQLPLLFDSVLRNLFIGLYSSNPTAVPDSRTNGTVSKCIINALTGPSRERADVRLATFVAEFADIFDLGEARPYPRLFCDFCCCCSRRYCWQCEHVFRSLGILHLWPVVVLLSRITVTKVYETPPLGYDALSSMPTRTINSVDRPRTSDEIRGACTPPALGIVV